MPNPIHLVETGCTDTFYGLTVKGAQTMTGQAMHDDNGTCELASSSTARLMWTRQATMRIRIQSPARSALQPSSTSNYQ